VRADQITPPRAPGDHAAPADAAPADAGHPRAAHDTAGRHFPQLAEPRTRDEYEDAVRGPQGPVPRETGLPERAAFREPPGKAADREPELARLRQEVAELRAAAGQLRQQAERNRPVPPAVPVSDKELDPSRNGSEHTAKEHARKSRIPSDPALGLSGAIIAGAVTSVAPYLQPGDAHTVTILGGLAGVGISAVGWVRHLLEEQKGEHRPGS
jgi:hypothetical protein